MTRSSGFCDEILDLAKEESKMNGLSSRRASSRDIFILQSISSQHLFTKRSDRLKMFLTRNTTSHHDKLDGPMLWITI
jgi:hypothetical protein